MASNPTLFQDPITGLWIPCICESYAANKVLRENIFQFYSLDEVKRYFICKNKQCGQIYILAQFTDNYGDPRYRPMKIKKEVTKGNYIGHYLGWCVRNDTVPLHWSILDEIFYGLTEDKEYAEVCEILYSIINDGVKLSFMTQADKDSIEGLKSRLKIRMVLFERIPSTTNMILAYGLMDEIFTKSYAQGGLVVNATVEKRAERYDKCKNLALGATTISERKVAFTRSLEFFNKLVYPNEDKSTSNV